MALRGASLEKALVHSGATPQQAFAEVTAELHRTLDALAIRHEPAVKAAIEEILAANLDPEMLKWSVALLTLLLVAAALLEAGEYGEAVAALRDIAPSWPGGAA